MELVPAGVPLSFEVTFDSPDLSVGMSVYDDTGASPVLVQGPTLMTLVALNTYRAKFTASLGHSYVVIKAVYTDGTLLEVDTDYAQGSESLIAQNVGGQQLNSIVGYVLPDDVIVGQVQC